MTTNDDTVRQMAEAMWRHEVADTPAASRARDAEQFLEQSASVINRWLGLARAALVAYPHITPHGTGVTEFQAAYGLLWRMRTTEKAIHEARRLLLNVIGKDGQRAGLDWALATFGPHEAPTLDELP